MNTQSISSNRENILHVADGALARRAETLAAYDRYKVGEEPDMAATSDLLEMHKILHYGVCRLTDGEKQRIYEVFNSG
jgi:hypothetical protein